MTVRKGLPWKPDWAVLPGETIRETYLERGLTQSRCAVLMGMKPSQFSDYVNGRRSITAPVAVKLEEVLGVSAALWMGLQTNYDVTMARLAAAQPSPEQDR